MARSRFLCDCWGCRGWAARLRCSWDGFRVDDKASERTLAPILEWLLVKGSGRGP